MAPNRFVGLLTPVLAPVAGAFAAWLSQNLPGNVVVPREAMEEVFIGGALVVLLPALQFIQNRFKWDQRTEDAAAVADEADARSAREFARVQEDEGEVPGGRSVMAPPSGEEFQEVGESIDEDEGSWPEEEEEDFEEEEESPEESWAGEPRSWDGGGESAEEEGAEDEEWSEPYEDELPAPEDEQDLEEAGRSRGEEA